MQTGTHRGLEDAQSVHGHPGKELSIVAPPEKRTAGAVSWSQEQPQAASSPITCSGSHLKMGQWAELSQWKPRFLCPVRMSQMMIACGSSCVSMRGLKVTRYLKQRGPVWGCGYHSPRLHPSVPKGTPWNSYTLQASSQTSAHERDTRAPLTSPTIHHSEF